MAFRPLQFALATALLLASAAFAYADDSDLCAIRPDLCDSPAPAKVKKKKQHRSRTSTSGSKKAQENRIVNSKAPATERTVIKRNAPRQEPSKLAHSFADYFRSNSNHPNLTLSTARASAFSSRRHGVSPAPTAAADTKTASLSSASAAPGSSASAGTIREPASGSAARAVAVPFVEHDDSDDGEQ